MFANDSNSAIIHLTQYRSDGVMRILLSDFSRYSIHDELTKRSIRNRYLVLGLLILDAPVYIQKYVNRWSRKRINFLCIFALQHLVSDEFSTPVGPAVGWNVRHETSRLACL